jgi:hypothetical protein
MKKENQTCQLKKTEQPVNQEPSRKKKMYLEDENVNEAEHTHFAQFVDNYSPSKEHNKN